MDAGTAGIASRYVGHTEGGWEFSSPGVMKKVLFTDESSGEMTLLLKFEPNSKYPLHNHPGKEEIIILEGDLRVGKHDLSFGDYLFTPEQGKHAVSSRNGCLLLIKLDQQIEILDRRSASGE